ncbi:hypothetical protein LA66_07030 [Aureimonas altamirensis]|uniref:Phage tail tape measure protein domain-containing protein n=1 Tax=Aureimonas altamirensis TaxID=370622 RepID=A0A0B1QAA3_9HYPH|nr:phage tail tape measure protein [Aureimonas altamirensis]KHJ56306.1 hypothetical protein LA66_07030 [Aureimonas altamirensis]
MAREVEARLKLSAEDRTAKAFQAIERRLKGVERQSDAVNRQNKHMAAWEQATARANAGMLRTGGMLVGAFAAAGGVRAGVDALTSFEDGLVEIQKKGGFTAAQMKNLAEEAKELATSGDLAVPIEEIMAAYARGAAAGLPVDELREFTIQAAKASDAFEMSAEDAANAIAGWKANLQMTNPEIARTLDLVNGLADAGISDEKDILQFLSRSGPVLKNVGFATDDIAALGSTLLNLQVEAETASRGMNSITRQILSPQSKKATGALEALFADKKGGYQEFRKRFSKDGMAGLQEFIGEISKLSGLDQLDAINQIIGGEFGPMFQRLAAASAELGDNLAFVADEGKWLGSLDEGYRLKLDALSSRWQVFKNELATVAIDAGTLGLPILKEGLEGARRLVDEIGDGFKTFGENIDQEALRSARESLASMASSMSEMMSIGGQESAIVQFFTDLATVTNDVAASVKTIKEAGEFLSDPFGLKGLDFESGEGKSNRFPQKRSYLGGLIEVDGGSAAGTALDWLSGAADWANGRNADVRAAGSWQSRLGSQQGQASDLQGQLQALRSELAASAPEARGAIESQIAMIERSLSSIDDRISAIQPSQDVIDYYDRQAAQRESIGASSRVGAAFGDDIQPAIDGLDQSSDALRQAMEASGAIVVTAGGDAGGAIQAGAQAGAAAIEQAAQSIENAGRNAAAAISAVRIPLPNGAAAAGRPPVNANLGQSMPNAGTPGG